VDVNIPALRLSFKVRNALVMASFFLDRQKLTVNRQMNNIVNRANTVETKDGFVCCHVNPTAFTSREMSNDP